MSSSEENYLEALVNDSASALTAADAKEMIQYGVPVGCILKAVAKLVQCGITKPTCIAAFVAEIIDCLNK